MLDVLGGNNFRETAVLPVQLSTLTGFDLAAGGAGVFAPLIVVHNISANPIICQMRAHTVYGIAANYIDNQVLEPYVCREPVGVLLDSDLQFTLSRGGVADSVEGVEYALGLAVMKAIMSHGRHKKATIAGQAGAAVGAAVHKRMGPRRSAVNLRAAGGAQVQPNASPGMTEIVMNFGRRAAKAVSDYRRSIMGSDSSFLGSEDDGAIARAVSILNAAAGVAIPGAVAYRRLINRPNPVGDDGGGIDAGDL
jgi:hypothetical protein